MKRNLFITGFSLLILSKLTAQSVVVPVGGTISGSGGNGSYSIGQIDFIALTNTTNAGVQQVYEPTGTLPVEFLAITATRQCKQVSVKWETATELNSSYFLVQRSVNGVDFNSKLGTVVASGFSTKVSRYSLLDKAPVMGTNYYRVKQVDRDGKFIYSTIVAVNFESGFQISIYPNPAFSFATLRIETSDVNGYSYELFDISGKMLRRSIINTATSQIDVRGFKPASYSLKIYNKDGKSYSFIIVKN